MKIVAGAILIAGLVIITPAQAQLTKGFDPALEPRLSASWAGNAANYRVAFQGGIDMGVRGPLNNLNPLPAIGRVTINAIMRNGVVVPIAVSRSGGTGPGGPDYHVFTKHLTGASRYVTDLDIAHLEVIYSVDWSLWRANENMRITSRGDDPWTLARVRVSGTLYRKEPLTGRETIVEQREIMDIRPMAEMRYGLWSTAEAPTFDPPREIQTAEGHLVIQLLTGEDGINANPAAVDVLIDRGGGPLRLSLRDQVRRRPLPAHVFWNYEGNANVRETLQWNAVGRVGLFYRYGEHGLDRDDWDVEAVLVNFCPDSLPHICFRKASHYLPRRARLVRLNGDRPGTQAWAPFIAGR